MEVTDDDLRQTIGYMVLISGCCFAVLSIKDICCKKILDLHSLLLLYLCRVTDDNITMIMYLLFLPIHNSVKNVCMFIVEIITGLCFFIIILCNHNIFYCNNLLWLSGALLILFKQFQLPCWLLLSVGVLSVYTHFTKNDPLYMILGGISICITMFILLFAKPEEIHEKTE